MKTTWEKHCDIYVLVDAHGWKRALVFDDGGVWHAVAPLGADGGPQEFYGTVKAKVQAEAKRRFRTWWRRPE
jgi:hypothetical protein